MGPGCLHLVQLPVCLRRQAGHPKIFTADSMLVEVFNDFSAAAINWGDGPWIY